MNAVVAPVGEFDRRTSFVPAVWALGRRSITRFTRLPSILIPVIVMPLFFLVAFSGSFSGVTRVEGFPTDEIVNWVAAYGMMQGAGVAGLGSVGVIATDLESGFMDRLLVSPIHRSAIIVGPLFYSLVRTLIPTSIVITAAVLLGGDLHGGLLGVMMAVVGVLGFALVVGCAGIALALRTGDVKALNLIQMAAFLLLLASIGQMPLNLIGGWLHTVARVNPVTNLLRMTRQGFLGDVTWADTWPGLLVILIGTTISYTWARLELHRYAP